MAKKFYVEAFVFLNIVFIEFLLQSIKLHTSPLNEA